MPVPERIYPQIEHSARYERQAFTRAHTSIGTAGDWVKTAGILTPLVIHEAIKDPEQKWRAIRLSALITAVLSEALWTARVRREREQRASLRFSAR